MDIHTVDYAHPDAVKLIACGSWRVATADAELKRMFVTPSFRGKGFSRELLAELERTALAAGRTRAVLETGTLQPEAIALYRSSGYTEIPKFGIYRHTQESICLAKELNGDLRIR
ncbi:GNAT family N-acetyltransferase [Amycolatopsis sp. NPDC059657]|uniref:GNAT family N-acetyltransferase n=1 Tax=Amycolatopsis sp. NPDC059657 TaxID=3346899 RepID=UPI00366F052F